MRRWMQCLILTMCVTFAGCTGMRMVKPNTHLANSGMIVFKMDCHWSNGEECFPQAWITTEGTPFGVKVVKDKTTGLYMIKTKPGKYQWKRVHIFAMKGFTEHVIPVKLSAFEVGANQVVYLGDESIIFGYEGKEPSMRLKTGVFSGPLLLVPFSETKWPYIVSKDNSAAVEAAVKDYLGNDNFKFIPKIIDVNTPQE